MSGQLLTEDDQRSNQSIDYVSLNGSLVAKRSTTIGGSTWTTSYEHTDALHSPVTETDASGVAARIERYTPYGEPSDGTYSQGPGFTGHVTDAATGLTYAQARYYDPVCGCFLSPDPNPVDTNTGLNFNRFNYASGNPYRYTDPDGRCPKGASPSVCIESTNKASAKPAKLTVEEIRADKAYGGRVVVTGNSSNEVLGAEVRNQKSGKIDVVVQPSTTDMTSSAAIGVMDKPEGMLVADHGHPTNSLNDDPKPHSMGDAGTLLKNGVPNIAHDLTNRRAAHDVDENGRYEVFTLGDTRFTQDEINHFQPVMNERQEVLNDANK